MSCTNHDGVNYWNDNKSDYLEESLESVDFESPKQQDDIFDNYSGRPPWYDSSGKMKEPYVVGLCGGSASGKTTVARKIIERIKVPWVVILSLDSFYKVLTKEQHEAANKMEYDFDSPNAIDLDLAIETLKKMKTGKTVKIPNYDFTTHTRLENNFTIVYGANVILVEGLMTFYCKEFYDLMDLKIFVDTDSDLRLCRRVMRDMEQRGRDLSSIILQYSRFVKPNFDKHISQTINLADIVIPWSYRQLLYI
uniref:uridine/cytidine kinase n=1 Tax=Henneguya salminicola TaxID=69463 RepID=A0A6G3MH57_HENSL